MPQPLVGKQSPPVRTRFRGKRPDACGAFREAAKPAKGSRYARMSRGEKDARNKKRRGTRSQETRNRPRRHRVGVEANRPKRPRLGFEEAGFEQYVALHGSILGEDCPDPMPLCDDPRRMPATKAPAMDPGGSSTSASTSVSIAAPSARGEKAPRFASGATTAAEEILFWKRRCQLAEERANTIDNEGAADFAHRRFSRGRLSEYGELMREVGRDELRRDRK